MRIGEWGVEKSCERDVGMTGRSHVRGSEKAEREMGFGGKGSEWRGDGRQRGRINQGRPAVKRLEQWY